MERFAKQVYLSFVKISSMKSHEIKPTARL